MALFKRKPVQFEDLEATAPVELPSWTRRLGLIGDAIDDIRYEIRDVVVVTDGGAGDQGAVINFLGHRSSTYHTVWTSIVYRYEEENAPDAPHNPRITIGAWGMCFRRAGALVDRTRPEARSATVIVLDTGIVINAIVPDETMAERWRLQSFAFTNDQIKAATPA